MEYAAVGAVLALLAGAIGTVVGFEKDRAFYPTILIVVGLGYDLFAAMAGSGHALGQETIAAAVVLIAAVVGFRFNLWIVVAGLVGHGLFDLVHGHIIENPGVPAWWPAFCMTYDVTAAGYLAWRLARSGGKPAKAAA